MSNDDKSDDSSLGISPRMLLMLFVAGAGVGGGVANILIPPQAHDRHTGSQADLAWKTQKLVNKTLRAESKRLELRIAEIEFRFAFGVEIEHDHE